MTRSLQHLLDELRRIPKATWTGADPTKPPVLRPSDTAEIDPADHTLVFDDTGYVVPVSAAWEEARRAITQRVTPDGRSSGAAGRVGLDALAWYASFHDAGERWGIYVPLSTLPLMDDLYLSGLPLSRTERWLLAWDVLIAHEIVHFAVDYACAWFELLFHAPIRRAFSDRMSAGIAPNIFPNQANYLEVEESLANGHALRTVIPTQIPEVSEVLRSFIRNQPPGYRDGELTESDEGFAVASAETLRGYLSVWSTGWNIDLGNPAFDLTRLLPLHDELRFACPVWTINDLEAVGLPPDAVKLITCIRQIQETRPFLKRVRELHPDQQRAWDRLKQRLAVTIPPSAGFKKWPPGGEGVWSVCVNDNFRAHLEQPREFAAPWLALWIGTHKEMGHG